MFYTVQGIAYGEEAIEPERIMLLSGNWRNESKGIAENSQKWLFIKNWGKVVCTQRAIR